MNPAEVAAEKVRQEARLEEARQVAGLLGVAVRDVLGFWAVVDAVGEDLDRFVTEGQGRERRTIERK